MLVILSDLFVCLCVRLFVCIWFGGLCVSDCMLMCMFVERGRAGLFWLACVLVRCALIRLGRFCFVRACRVCYGLCSPGSCCVGLCCVSACSLVCVLVFCLLDCACLCV